MNTLVYGAKADPIIGEFGWWSDGTTIVDVILVLFPILKISLGNLSKRSWGNLIFSRNSVRWYIKPHQPKQGITMPLKRNKYLGESAAVEEGANWLRARISCALLKYLKKSFQKPHMKVDNREKQALSWPWWKTIGTKGLTSLKRTY